MFLKEDQDLPILSPGSHMKYQDMRERAKGSPLGTESIEQVEGKLQAFQDRLLEYGKDMFGDDFVIMALSDTQDGEQGQAGGQGAALSPPATTKGHRVVRRNELIPGSEWNEKKNLLQAKKDKKAKENAKSVLMRFLEDREELVKLRVINKAAQERLQERIGRLESTMRRLNSVLKDFERRKKTEILNTRAFLSELRKKLTSVERRQSRLLALITMPDNEHRDAVLERHSTIEKKETKSKRTDVQQPPKASRHEGEDSSHAGLEDTLSQLSKELKDIERSMKSFGEQNTSSL